MNSTAAVFIVFALSLLSIVCATEDETKSCISMAADGFRDFPDDRSKRFMGKVDEDTAHCRGGDKAVAYRHTPWVDWQNYYATGDTSSLKQGREAITKLGEHLLPNGRGIDGALIDLEYQRIELIKFNLFDPNTYEDYILGRDGQPGATIKTWDEMRLPPEHPAFQQVGGVEKQLCRGELITHRTLTGICNDIENPLMGSSGMPFARNMRFEDTFPRLGLTELTRNRHGERIDLLKPDPQLISRKLFTREQTPGNGCNHGNGAPNYSANADCDYLKAPFFNVLAAFWIQFMTHDWFSHPFEGRNELGLTSGGCLSDEAEKLGCRQGDRHEASLFKNHDNSKIIVVDGNPQQRKAHKTTRNHITAWWDLSQIYGHDELSLKRVQRDPNDKAKLRLHNNYLPTMTLCPEYSADCPVHRHWLGQEAAGFPDNWSVGMSFYHNLFTREHNYFINRFRDQQRQTPDDDSGLRNPDNPEQIIRYRDVTDERLYHVARLVTSAEVAKIHTVEWTTQLLYNEPLYLGMNSNWFGIFNQNEDRVSRVLRRILAKDESFLSRWSGELAGLFADTDDPKKANSLYSVLASGSGIFGLGNSKAEGALWWEGDGWDVSNPDHVNGGINHFGSPFNFPEEFTSVYRLHGLMPDLFEFRELNRPNDIKLKIPVIDTVRGKATGQMQQRGMENWALSMGRQRLGLLHPRNLPLFLQNFEMPHLDSPTKKLDIVALDLIRDRERGIPRFNEFRRQIGLKTLTSFDDFIDARLAVDDPWRQHQQETVKRLREVYGTHTCDANKIISVVQRNPDGSFINDCLGHPDGSIVDNIEDVDNVVGWLSEYTRPHGFAISETQFHIFILNASRRLFSDRFFTSSFRPEFYSHMGYDWVIHNGPITECPYTLSKQANGQDACLEPLPVNGHVIQVSPLKRLMMRNVPELKRELMPVKNMFDPWARDRGQYYELAWKPRRGAESDPAFSE